MRVCVSLYVFRSNEYIQIILGYFFSFCFFSFSLNDFCFDSISTQRKRASKSEEKRKRGRERECARGVLVLRKGVGDRGSGGGCVVQFS